MERIVELLESAWFFRMVEAQGKTPVERLIAVFSVTAAWISAPGIREGFLKNQPGDGRALHSCASLKEFLTASAISAKAQNPSGLVTQLTILLQGAIAEEIRNPDAHAIAEAARAARAVVAKACQPRRNRLRLSAGGLAAAAVIAAIGYYPATRAEWPGAAQSPAPGIHRHALAASNRAAPAGSSPDSIHAVLALHEQIEQGICPAPQLLALPPGQVTAYMNVIHFRTPDDPIADRENIRAFLAWFERTRSRECYSPPSNGHTHVAWVAG